MYIELLALPYTLYAQTMIVCGDYFFSTNIESNNSKCCPALPEAWVPANAGTHAKPLYIYKKLFVFKYVSCELDQFKGRYPSSQAALYYYSLYI